MNRDDYESLQAKAHERFRASLRRARVIREEELDAIDRVWALAQDAVADDLALETSAPTTARTLVNQVRAAVAVLGDRFTAKDVRQHIAQVYGDETKKVRNSSVSSALGRMATAKEICVLEHGFGRRPTTYSQIAAEMENDANS